jgi:hypothetical protein
MKKERVQGVGGREQGEFSTKNVEGDEEIRE